MSTEHCTFDQLDSRSKTETFAKHLQHRLRSLSVDGDRENGLEDPSWNCDQLSSSSDNDIYYDLDSYPGSPAVEATEDYPDYIQINSDGNFINHVDTQGNGDSINGEGYSSHSDLKSDTSENCFCLNGSTETTSIPKNTCNRLDNSCKVNGDYSDTNGFLPQAKETHGEILSNGEEKLVPSPDSGVSESVTTFKENGLPGNYCPCATLECNEKTDLNCNSTVFSNSLINGSSSSKLEDERGDGVPSGEVPSLPSRQEVEEPENERKKSQDITEDALCRLVESVFPDGSSQTKDEESDDEEDIALEVRRAKLRRSSSLKSGKTPPGTPGQKKIVRFADVLGLDLADVRTFLDEIPKVPKSAYEDLQGFEMSSSPVTSSLEANYLSHIKRQPTTLVALFIQPSSRPDFLDRVRDQYVCLENALVSDMSLFAITGVVRVKNIDFNKSVHIRYSIDSWKTFADLQARYVPSSCDGFSDKFTFLLYAHMLAIGQRLEFAVRYQARGNQYWDSNFGLNYAFQCVQQDNSRYASPVSQASNLNMEGWASFY